MLHITHINFIQFIQLYTICIIARSCTQYIYIYISVLLTVSKSLDLWLVLFWLTTGLSGPYIDQYKSIYPSLDLFLSICIGNASKTNLSCSFYNALVLDHNSQAYSLSCLVPTIQKNWPSYSRHAKEQLPCWTLSLILPSSRSNSCYNSIHNF